MITIELTAKFIREYRKYSKNSTMRKNAVDRAVFLFTRNPSHPSLNLEKLSSSAIYSIRINHADRLFLKWKNTITAIFVDIGKHDKYREY